MAPKETRLGRSGWVGSVQVVPCEAAQGNAFRRVELGLVVSCRVRPPKETRSYGSGRVGFGRFVSCEATQGNTFIWVGSSHVLMALKEMRSGRSGWVWSSLVM